MDRRLLKATLTSGSSKVFNCLSMTKSLASSQEIVDEDYVFSVKALNYAVYFKEPSEKGRSYLTNIPIDTLLYVPYNSDNLTEGGVSVSLNDRRFEAVVQEFSQSFGTAEHKSAATDRAILDIFKKTPSLDPYLLKSEFHRANINIPSHYLKISEDEWRTIRDYVRSKLFPMVTFGMKSVSAANPAKIDNFVDKIWDGSDHAYRVNAHTH
ncbi:MAG: hypothetical protein WCF85_20045 [Rhodospirillaceae bacterium]